MKQSEDLRRLLESIDRKSYPAYKSAQGAYQFGNFTLSIDHVQGDPFAAPSKVSITVAHQKAGYPVDFFDKPWKKTAFEDYLIRQFGKEIAQYNFKAKGSGKSGFIAISSPGPEILSRTACECSKTGITARFEVGFPANGRTINSGELIRILFDFLPRCVRNVFFYASRISLGLIATVSLCYYLFSQEVVTLFMKDPEIVAYGGRFLRGMCLGLPFLCMDFLAVGVFQACGFGKKALLFAILRKIVLEIPALIVLNWLFPLYGLAYAQCTAEVVLATAAIIVLAALFRDVEENSPLGR